jgi:Kyakuja-Dileera-Zisupton transposase
MFTFYLLIVREKLHDEPELKYRRLLCMDGNDSLKRIRTIGQRQTADIRVFSESDYFIPREEVDKFANEVRGRVSVKSNAVSSDDHQEEWEDVADDIPINPEDSGGDPTDGTGNLVIDGCVNNWKAAQSDSKKRSWEIFDENGLFASACRHGLILWIMDMVRSGEL